MTISEDLSPSSPPAPSAVAARPLRSDCPLMRIKTRPEFLHVQKAGRRWTSRVLALEAAPNGREESRVGFTVSKKTAKKAVIRNRIKRRLRAAAAEVLGSRAVKGYDYVLVGRIGAFDCPYATLCAEIVWCLRKMTLLDEA